MGKLLKWVLAGVGIVAVLFVVAAIVLPMVIDPNNYKEEIRAGVLEETGRDLVIGGEIQWTVFPSVGLGLSDLTLGNHEGFGDQPMISVGEARVSVKLLPLLRGKMEIGKVVLSDLMVNLERKANGQTNWDDLGTTGTTTVNEDRNAPEVLVSGIEISNANVSWRDIDQITEIKDFALTTSAISPGQPFDLEGSFSVNLAQSLLAGKAGFGGRVQSSADGNRIEIEGFEFSFNGMQGPAEDLMTLDLGISANANVDLEKDTATLSDFSLRLQDLLINGKINIANFDHPHLDFDFQTDRLNLDDYLTETDPAVDEPDLTVDDFKLFTGGGDFRIGELRMAGLTATDVSMTVKAGDAGVRLSPIKAQFYGGQQQGEINIDASGERPLLTMSQKLTGVQAGTLLAEVMDTRRLQGVADLEMKITTDLTNTRTTFQTLGGNVGLKVMDGAIVGVDVTEIIKVAKLALNTQEESAAETGGDAKTEFSQLTVSGVIKHGVLRSEDLDMRSPLLRMTGKGAINLVEETIDYIAKPVLINVIGTQSLAGLSGVPVPLKISGSLFEPGVAVDIVGAVAGSQKAKIDQKKDEVLGQLLGGNGDVTSGDDAAEPEDLGSTAKSLFKGLLGGTKDEDEEDDGGPRTG